MSKTVKKLDKDTIKYRDEMFEEVAKLRRAKARMNFATFDGEYKEFAKIQQRYDIAIHEILNNIRLAVKIARDEVNNIGEVY